MPRLPARVGLPQALVAQPFDGLVVVGRQRAGRAGQQQVGERRVAHQDRPVQVGRHHRTLLRSLGPAVAVAGPGDQPAQGSRTGAEACGAAVVLVPRQRRQVEADRVGDDLADGSDVRAARR